MVRWKYKDYDTGKQVEGTPFGGFAIPFFRALERLAKAVEAGDKPLIKKELEALFKMDAPTSAPYFISEELGNQLVSRMVMLGLDADAAKLRAWVRDRNRGITLTGSFGPDERLWEMTVQRVLGETAPTKDKAGENLEQLMRAFRAICKEIAGLDPAALRSDRESRRRDSIEGNLSPSHRSISVYESTLEGMLGQLFTSMQLNYQVLLDEAIAELEGGKGTKGLEEAKKMIEERIKPLVFFRAGDFTPEDVLIDATRSTFGRGGGRYLDVFSPKSKARSIGFTFYDTLQKEGDEKQLALGRIWRHRHNQIELLERLYGVGKANAENATVLKQLGGLRLHNNDDWRRFLIAKFEAAQQRLGDDGKALSEVIDLLKAYLQAFTIHTPYNIEDFGDNYLTRSFPRALTGQLIHDCGVYALRIAYALSLIKDRLKLRFRFIRLPAHVGAGDHRQAACPTFIAHNNDVTEIGEQELDDRCARTGRRTTRRARSWPSRARTTRTASSARPRPASSCPSPTCPSASRSSRSSRATTRASTGASTSASSSRTSSARARVRTAQFHLQLPRRARRREADLQHQGPQVLEPRREGRVAQARDGLRRALGAAQKGGAGRAQGLRGRRRRVSQGPRQGLQADRGRHDVVGPEGRADLDARWRSATGADGQGRDARAHAPRPGGLHLDRADRGAPGGGARAQGPHRAGQARQGRAAVGAPGQRPRAGRLGHELVERGLEVAAERLGVGQDLGVGEDPEADLPGDRDDADRERVAAGERHGGVDLAQPAAAQVARRRRARDARDREVEQPRVGEGVGGGPLQRARRAGEGLEGGVDVLGLAVARPLRRSRG